MKRIVNSTAPLKIASEKKPLQKDYIRIPIPRLSSTGRPDFFTLLIIALLLIAAYVLGMLTIKIQTLGKNANTVATAHVS